MIRPNFILVTLIIVTALAKAAVADPMWDGIAAFHRGDYASALRSFRSLAEQGSSQAQFYLGYMYYNGKGVPENYVEAAKWFQKSAAGGDDTSQATVRHMYLNGLGLPQSYVEAKKWLLMARQTR